MKIGLNASYLTKNQKTGIENYSCQIIFSLLKHDKKNEFFLFSPKPISAGILPKTDNYSLCVSPLSRGWHRFRLPLALLKNRVDVFFDPGYTVVPFTNIPCVVTIHDLAHRIYPEYYSNSEIRAQKWAFHFAAKKARGLVFTSKNTLNDFEKYYPNSHAVKKVIYQGYNRQDFDISNDKDVLKLNSPYILFVGRLEMRKNIVNIIRSYVIFRHKNPELSHKLVLCGRPGFGYDKISREISSSEKFSRDIIELGFVDQKNLPHIYRNAVLLFFPSNYEGFGIPILEAFASRLPVVTSHSSSLPEIAGDAAIYCDNSDTENMADALIKTVLDQNIRRKLIKLGSLRLNKFSWKFAADSLISLFEDILR